MPFYVKGHIERLLSHTLLYIKIAIKANKNAALFAIFLEKFIIWRIFSVEPFGIFQFLQSLLTKTEESEALSTENAEQKPTDPPSEEPKNPVPDSSPAQDAFLGFLSMHDRRAKNVKKP